MRVSKYIELDYGHTLSQHYGFCNQIHGHRGKVVAIVEGEIQTENGSSQGMVLDFKFLKQSLMEKVHDILDHGFAVWKEDKDDLEYIKKRNNKYIITDEPPTAEYLAKWAYHQVVGDIPKNMKLVEIQWYETPTSVAYYSIDDYLKINERKVR